MLLSAFAIAVEVVLRKGFNVSLRGVDEISSYVFAVGVAWAFAFALVERAHIRIDLVYERLPSRWQVALDVLALVALIGLSLLFLHRAALTTLNSFEIGARSSTPLGTNLWIPQGLWAMGILLFVLAQVAMLYRVLTLWRRHGANEASRVLGIRSVEDEARMS
jgi:TRAP-type mannitol/chloroaromatic compound transport system permease small subunit